MNRVAELLKINGPMLSGDLARKYETAYGVSNDTARKAISRARPPVNKLYKFKFNKNQMFYYLESQFMGDKYTDALLAAIKQHSKVIYTYIQAFIAQNGYVSKNILPAFTGAPVGNVKGHKGYSDILNSLIQTGIIEELGEERYMLSPSFYKLGKRNLGRSIGLETAKKIIINDFDDWASKVNLVAYGKGKGLFDEPDFAQFQWGYTAPSYIQPLYAEKEEQPGFVIADVFYGKTATKETVQFFIDKLNVIRSFRNISSLLPVLLVDKIDADALHLLKKNKVMVAILSKFFTDKYTELLNDLVNLFANVTAIINKNPDALYELFDALAKNEGRYNNMSGELFELLVGSYFMHIGCTSLRSQVIARDDESGRYKELDWLAEREGALVVVECKATKAEIDEKFVRKWLNENIPFTRRWILDRFANTKMEFQLWSVGGFTKKALELLRKAEEENCKYCVKYFNREQMLALAKDKNDKHFVQIMDKHFRRT